LGLLIRVVLFFGGVGALIYFARRALSSRRRLLELESAEISRELARLRAERDAGRLDANEYELLVHEVYRRAQERGVPIPESRRTRDVS